ncbi:MAG: hypothetical protein NW216_04445 [Hyphomicrobium sp.]|nr:hypothetical protein [Hyphomicrobium sp.]
MLSRSIVTLIAMIFWCVESAQAVFDEQQCSNVLREIAEESGAVVVRETELGRQHLRHGSANEFVLYCGTLGLEANLTADTATPDRLFFDLVALVGQFAMGEASEALRPVAIQCQKRALTSPEELAKVSTKHGDIECHSFARDGGGTHLSWFRRYNN